MTFEQRLVRALGGALGFSLSELFWYVLLAGALWLFFYVVFRAAFRHRRISRREPTARQVGREVLHSLRSLAIFGGVTGGVVYAVTLGWTRMYHRVDQHGWGWFFASIGLMILLHDAYFYWTHRAMHHRWLFRLVHHTHHKSTSPTPWAAYDFSAVEALVQAGIGPLIVFTIPVHPAAFGLFMAWQLVFNVLGHCGHELFPRWFMRSPAGLVLNSVTHHALHHEKFRANFGLYFNVWDRLMGTNHREYQLRFEQAAGAARKPADREEEFDCWCERVFGTDDLARRGHPGGRGS
jgi:sterol desaturase/sphingolipid hydroxylase (fatty acid hydroxylase superfamily)